jgi:2'-5' RNA ligase
MAFGVSLWFDEAFEDAVRAVWRAVAEAGVATKLVDGPYRPHVTLGVWERVDRPAADEALAALTAARAPFAVRFDAFGAFSGPVPGLFATPTVTTRLRELHESAYAMLAPHAHEPTARRVPEAWNPHCTLAWGLPAERLPAALAVALRALPLPITGMADRVGLIDTPAEVELAWFPFAAAAPGS